MPDLVSPAQMAQRRLFVARRCAEMVPFSSACNLSGVIGNGTAAM